MGRKSSCRSSEQILNDLREAGRNLKAHYIKCQKYTLKLTAIIYENTEKRDPFASVSQHLVPRGPELVIVSEILNNESPGANNLLHREVLGSPHSPARWEHSVRQQLGKWRAHGAWYPCPVGIQLPLASLALGWCVVLHLQAKGMGQLSFVPLWKHYFKETAVILEFDVLFLLPLGIIEIQHDGTSN